VFVIPFPDKQYAIKNWFDGAQAACLQWTLVAFKTLSLSIRLLVQSVQAGCLRSKFNFFLRLQCFAIFCQKLKQIDN
jgi:hypothetical protein